MIQWAVFFLFLLGILLLFLWTWESRSKNSTGYNKKKIDNDGSSISSIEVPQSVKALEWTIFFLGNDSQIEEKSIENIKQPDYPIKKIIIRGHSDQVGSIKSKKQISKERAQEAKKLLQKLKYNEEIISIEIVEDKEPLSLDPSQIHKNRRVEIRFIPSD
jgi:outer membrane protein OmpA-like peptidoglycan-associated protein